MIKFALPVLIGTFFLLACNKNDSGSVSMPVTSDSLITPYYFNVTIDGVTRNFNYKGVAGVIIDTFTQTHSLKWKIQVSGYLRATNSSEKFTVVASGGENAAVAGHAGDLVKSYSDLADSNSTAACSDLTSLLSPVSTSGFTTNNLHTSDAAQRNPFQLTVMAIDGTTIRGTIKGIVPNNDNTLAATSYETIATGDFYMPLTKK